MFYYNENTIVEVVRSRRKTLGLEIKDGRIIARIPQHVTEKELMRFIERHRKWIDEKLLLSRKRLEKRINSGEDSKVIPVNELTGEEIRQITDRFLQKVRKYAGIMGVTYNKVTIKNQKTRWGSCSSKGNLNFNYQLFFLPEELMDYVVIHELAHRKFMNHSAEFWKEVEKYCPDYRECRKKLEETGIQ